MSGKKRKVDSTNDDITSENTKMKNDDDERNDDNSRNVIDKNKNDNNNNINNKTNNSDYDNNNNYIRHNILPKPLLLLQSHDHHDSIKYLKIITWNVNGFTSLYNKNLNKLLNLFNIYQPDILCLQETKIQENLINDYKYLINDYISYWNCSTVKKGI